MAAQTVPVSTAITAPLIFTQTSSDGSAPVTVTGPIGAVSSSDPTVTPALSADGQAVNLTTPASGTFTLTWHDPAGVVADFSVTLTDQVPVLTVTGAFGVFVPGTTP